MFFKGSRYLGVKDYTVVNEEGREVSLKRTRKTVTVEADFIYQVKQGDRLDLLAYKFYRTPRKWWLICDANPHLMYPDDLLVPGTKLLIPRDRRGY